MLFKSTLSVGFRSACYIRARHSIDPLSVSRWGDRLFSCAHLALPDTISNRSGKQLRATLLLHVQHALRPVRSFMGGKPVG